jgi:hypothetical protein
MRKRLTVALAAAALAVVPLGASPARAAETHICDIFAPPYDSACRKVVILYCKVTPDSFPCR